MRVLLGFALCACMTGCAARAPAGLAWPQAAAGDGDGGESLAPRAAARAIAAIAEDEKPADRAAAEKPAAAAPAPASADRSSVTAAAPAAGQAPADDAMTTEEIVIEVED